MKNEDSKSLRAAFKSAYIFPFAEYVWRSKRTRCLWIDVEVWQDALAGPIYAIVEHGNCAYVYKRDDEFFTGVSDPTALLVRLRQWHASLVAELDTFDPDGPDEKADFEAMRGFASEMWSVAERAIDIEQRRYAALRA